MKLDHFLKLRVNKVGSELLEPVIAGDPGGRQYKPVRNGIQRTDKQ